MRLNAFSDALSESGAKSMTRIFIHSVLAKIIYGKKSSLQFRYRYISAITRVISTNK